MTRRVGLYGRFSGDKQNPRSAADQLVEGRRYAERLGVQVVAEFMDEGISGASAIGRAGYAELLAAARAGAFDIVIAESLSRLARSGGDTWDLFDDLQSLGIELWTIAEGRVEEMAIGLKGTMNQLFLKDLAVNVRRGQTAVVRSGRQPGAAGYGYRARRVYDAAGEPIRGLREVDPDEALVVTRIAADFLAGSSAQAIAKRLNAEEVAGPAGGAWTAPAVLRALRNPLYAGEMVWNRRKRLKDRRTGKVRHRANPDEDLVREPAPDLAILEPATWTAIQDRLAAVAAAVAEAGNPSAANRPKRLLSGLVRCASCGAAMQTTGPGRRYRCRTRTEKGPQACGNARTAPADDVEAEVLAQLRRDLLHPEIVETVVRAYAEARKAKGAGQRAREAAAARELAETERAAERLVDLAAELGSGRTVAAKLAKLEARQVELEAELGRLRATADVVAFHPATAARYRKLVEDLAHRLDAARGDTAARDAARAALRKVVRQVTFIPGEARGSWTVTIDGDLTGLFDVPAAASVARAAI